MSHRDVAWLASQRWFRSKQRPIAAVDEIDRAPVTDHAALTVVAVSYRDGNDVDRYLVPLVDDREPEDGDGSWLALACSIATGAMLAGDAGRFVATADVAPAFEPRDGETERRLRVEQSNTSVVLGGRLMLKLYRLLEPGVNPDIEVGTFLTRAGFVDTPAVGGAALSYVDGAGAPAAAAMLQSFVPSHGDAWSAVLAALGSDPGAATRISGELGALTRRLHAALASQPHDPEFPARPATASDAGARGVLSAEHQLALALAVLTGATRARLARVAPLIEERLADAFDGAGGVPVSRIHGDYHLGQVLSRTDGGFAVIDFEGEPARPLAERRLATSPLRDVAGMLRSLDYAARTAQADPAWLPRARASFLAGYGGIQPEEQRLVKAFELEKACYEVRYEAGNRPDWLWLPLAALEREVTRQD